MRLAPGNGRAPLSCQLGACPQAERILLECTFATITVASYATELELQRVRDTSHESTEPTHIATKHK